MSGLFNTLNTATKGLMAQQTALHTVGHNLSNANTVGYSRQRVDFKADLAYNLSGVGQLGTGVKMEGIVRMVNEYVHNQIMGETGTYEKFQSKSETMEQLEIIFNEPSETGLNFNLNEMFDSFQELSKNPESLNAKTVVVEKSKSLAATINHMANQIDILEDETLSQIKKNAYDFNSIVDRIDSLNKQIFNVAIKGQVPNDLLDQRDLMLKELSGITEFDHSFDKYGGVSISIDDKEILGDSKQEMSMVTDINENDDGTWTVSIAKRGDSLDEAKTYTFKDAADIDKIKNLSEGDIVLNQKEIETGENIEFTIPNLKSGRLEGYQDSLNDINERRINLDNFAKNMAKAVNMIHSNLLDDDGNSVKGINFFESSDGDDINAGNIKLNGEIIKDSGKVNAGKVVGGPEGDGSRALALARLRNTKLDFNDPNADLDYDNDNMNIKDHTGGVTIEGAYRDIVTKVGVSKEHADQMVDNQEVLLAQLEFKRESTSGVSIDEEVGNLVQFQKAYEANAKVISVLTEMLDVLINRTGV